MNVAIVNCFDTFWDRQESLRRHFSARGDTVTSLLSDFCHMSKHYRTEAPEKYTLIHASPYHKNISLRRLLSHERFSAAVLRQLKSQKWDLIWVIAPPNSLIQRCMEYKQSHPDTKIVIDINDLWPETFPLGHIKSLPPFHWWKRLRDRHLSQADYIVTECNLFRDRLKLADHPRCSTIYMCKPSEQVIPVNLAPALSDSTYSLCYLGSINHIIDIDAIVDIIRAFMTLRPVTLHVIGEGENLSLIHI